jgi:hypothetical protein
VVLALDFSTGWKFPLIKLAKKLKEEHPSVLAQKSL